jgi:hypothetical protein
MDSVFLPKVRSTNGKSATFTLSGGENNVTVRVYGFKMLTVPVIEELVDGKWVTCAVNSSTPDSLANTNAYDGYMAHYDGDGSFSYSFVTTLTGDGQRTFRVSADKAFEGWPENADSEENEVLLKIISKASPDLLIVCLGFPRQERWVTENRPRLTSVKVMMALGGSLDVWSGRRRRAPRIIRRLKLEWLWRILREPSRIPRAAVLPSFVNLTLRAARVQKRNFKAKLS